MAITTIATIADTHANAYARWAEHCRVMSWFVDDVDRRGVDLVLHGGDIYETASTPEERAFIHDWIQVLTERRALGIVGGNHEAAGDVAALGRLRTKHAIVAAERPEVHELAGVAVAFLPWPRKAHLLAAMGQVIDTATTDTIAVGCLRDVIRGLGMSLAEHDGPRVLLAHAMIDGANTDHDQPLCGAAMAISLADLALARAHMNLVGHIHAQNDWPGPTPTIYPGAPRHTNFGEPGPRKGYVIARFDGPRLLDWERIQAPCRPMLLLCGRYEGSAVRYEIPAGAVLPGAEVRLRYKVRAEDRVAAAHAVKEAQVALLAAGAYSVKPEADTIANTVARAPEVAAAPTTAAALTARWDRRGQHDVPRRGRLLDKLARLEAEAR